MESDIVEEKEFVYKNVRKTQPYMSIYEYSAILTAVSLQLTTKNELNIEIKDYNLEEIAKQLLLSRKVNLIVRRKLPDGTTEDWYVHELILPRL